MLAQVGLDLIVIDYLQLLRTADRRQNSYERVTEVSNSLKSLATDLELPVLALAQLSREGAKGLPTLEHLRDSGAIEQDADVILFIYRDEVYNEDSPDKGIAEIIVGKQRNGPIGTVKLTFLGRHTRFENHAGPSGY